MQVTYNSKQKTELHRLVHDSPLGVNPNLTMLKPPCSEILP